MAKPKLRNRMRALCTAGSRLLASQKRTMGSPVKTAQMLISPNPSSVTTTGLACAKTVTSSTPRPIPTASKTNAPLYAVLPKGMNSWRKRRTKKPDAMKSTTMTADRRTGGLGILPSAATTARATRASASIPCVRPRSRYQW